MKSSFLDDVFEGRRPAGRGPVVALLFLLVLMAAVEAEIVVQLTELL